MRIDRLAHRRQDGQALAELTVSLIVMAVVFLGILLIGDLSQARLSAILESRATAAPQAMAGMIMGSSSLYGTADVMENLKTDVLDPLEHPIAYSQYQSPAHPYMTENVIAPFYDANQTASGIFVLSTSEITRMVTNMPFLVSLGMGRSTISVKQKTSIPLMQDFP